MVTEGKGPNSVFLSYAREDDEPFVRRLYLDLQSAGHTVWWDRESMPSRALTFPQEIRDAIEGSDRLVLVVGPKAISSEYVQAEWEHALLFGRSVVPILRRGDYESVPGRLSKLHIPDFRTSRPYVDALRELLRILDEPLLPLGMLYGVPSLPPHFVSRTEDMSAMNATVLGDVLGPVVITSQQQSTALLGMGGVGKTALAVAFARAMETRRAFVDGIVWVSMGGQRDSLSVMRLVGSVFGQESSSYADLGTTRQLLAGVLERKACLIVLDDAWQVAQVEPIAECIGSRCRLLLTTRDGTLVSALGSQEHRLDVMSATSALRLLAQWAGVDAGSLEGTEALDVARECGYLPFALALSGAIVRDGVSWSDVRTALANADTSFISRQLPGYPYPGVFRSLQVSLDRLRTSFPDDAARYGELAVFPRGEEVPEAAIVTLWGHTAALKDFQVRKLLVMLERKALVTLSGTERNRRVRLHDLQLDYLCSLVDDAPALHRRILAAYNARTPGGWESAPNDGYYFEHVVYHHVKGAAHAELKSVLTNLSFLETKVRVGLVFDLVRDFTAALEFFDSDSDAAHMLRIIAEAIRTDLHFISLHPDLLFQCCWNRMYWYDSPEKDWHDQAGRGAPLETRNQRPPTLCALMEAWRRDKTARTPGFVWLRSHRPPPVALGSPLRAKLSGHRSSVKGVAFSPDGRHLASTGEVDLRVWDIATGREKLHIPRSEILLVGPSGVAYSPDGRHMVTSEFVHPARQEPSGGRLRIFDAEDGHEVATLFDGGSIMCFAYSPDGTRLAIGSGDGKLRIWNAVSFQQTLDVTSSRGAVMGMSFSPDSRRVACSGGHVVVLDASSGEQLLSIAPRYMSVSGIAYSPNGLLLAVATHDLGMVEADDVGLVELFDAGTGAPVRQFEGHRSDVATVTFAPDGLSIASAGDDYTVRVWDVATGGEQLRLESEDRTLLSLAYSPDGRLLAAGSSGGPVWIWDVTRRSGVAMPHGHEKWISSLAFSPDGTRLATTSDDSTVRLWNVQDGQQYRVLRGHSKWTRSATYSPDGRWLATGSGDQTVRIWDAVTGDETHVLHGHKEPVNSVAFSPDSQMLASGSSDRTICLWELATARLIRVLKSEQNSIDRVSFSMDGTRVMGARIDEWYFHADLWDVRSGRLVLSSEDWRIGREFAPTPKGQWEMNSDLSETTVRDRVTRRNVAWFHEPQLFGSADHPSGRTWAASSGRNLYIFTLEGEVA
jgi:WD40 repeat protein